MLAEQVVKAHHKQYLAWKKRQRMVREAVASFNGINGVAAEEQLPSLGPEEGDEEMNGDVVSNEGSVDEGMDE